MPDYLINHSLACEDNSVAIFIENPSARTAVFISNENIPSKKWEARSAFVGHFQGAEALVPVLMWTGIDEYRPYQNCDNAIQLIRAHTWLFWSYSLIFLCFSLFKSASLIFSFETEIALVLILPDSRYHAQGAAVISELLKKGSISKKDYNSIVGRYLGDKLLETNVFALHDDSRVTFQSTLVKRYCQEEYLSGGKK